MSDTEYETDISDVDSFGTVEVQIAALNHLITELYGEAEELEEHLAHIQKPLEGLQVSQLGQLPFLEASPFRQAAFKVKPPGFPGVELHKRYPFHIICALLRTHLISTGAVMPNGQVKLGGQLQALFGIKEPVVGFVTLLGALRRVLE
jgi:hypothetical protein